MSTEKEVRLYQDRLKKLEALKKTGIDPYPATAKRTHSVAEVLAKFSNFSQKKKKVYITGRIRAIRTHGGLTFGNLEDESGTIQFMLKEDEIGQEKFRNFEKYFDIGDFLETGGTLLETKRGERTLLVSDYKILAKSLRSLPEKWHGLVEIETKLRKRYLDILAHPEVREMFVKKARFWKAIREYLEKQGFIEVDTPVLEDKTGGANAAPFVTHYNALDRDFYLRISLELPLKEIIIGGFEKVYEIGKVFRNEGISAEHLQDYLMCEFYWAYADYKDLMEMVPDMYRHVVKETTGGLVTTWQGHKIDWGNEWPRLDYFQSFKERTGIDLEKAADKELAKTAQKLGIKIEKSWGRGKVIDSVYKKKVRSGLVQPVFLINHPLEVSPLAKRSPTLPGRVERLQIVVAGTEVGNGYSELNDPRDQRQRFEEEMKLREAGDEEAQMMDESFVEALEYGMPPTAGFGLSERFFAILMDKSVRETVIFPPMKKEKN